MGKIQELKKTGFCFFLFLILTSCQKEDVKQDSFPHFSNKEVGHKMVTATDIPEVMGFLRANASSDLRYTIHAGGILGSQTRSGEPDLVISELMTEQILAVTNEAYLTNYSFQLRVDTAPYYEGEISFFNLIVKETTAQEGYYAYIQEYRMDENWYVSNNYQLNMHSYTGKMIFYTLEGLYVAKVDFSNGQIVGEDLRSPCPDGGGSSGGGGSTSGPGGDGGGSTGGTGGGNGGGGSPCYWWVEYVEVGCICVPGNTSGCPGPTEIAVITIFCPNHREALRSPCCDGEPCELPEECWDAVGDPCPNGCNVDGTCFEENPDTGVNPPNYNLLLILGLNNYLQTSLTIEQSQWIHANNENYEFAMQVWDMLINNVIDGVQAQNWFFGSVPDFEIDLNINPLLISYETALTQQPLPSMQDFLNNFPKLGSSGNYTQMPTTDVFYLVGGSLWVSHQNNPSAYSNACSIRGSRGLLYSGIEIPILNYPNVGQRTQKGGDQLNYILDAVSFNKFMFDKFGPPTYYLEGAAANDAVQVASLLSGKNGIYVIINNSHNQAGYSGHVDVIINGNCIGGAYTTPNGGVKSIGIWELN